MTEVSIELVHFLQEELAISPNSIALALRHGEQNSSQLFMVLWQYGLVTKEQLELLFDWQDATYS